MNLGDMVALIQDDLIDSRVTQVQIINAINVSIDLYKRMTFYFNDNYFTFDMVTGQEYYDENDDPRIPNIFNIDYISVKTAASGGFNNTLTAVLDSDIQNAQNNSLTQPITGNTPYSYAYTRQKIRVFPIPAGTGTFACSASYKQASLTNIKNTSKFFDEASELIRNSAKVNIALNVFNDAELAQGPSASVKVQLDALLAETRKRQAQVDLKMDAALSPLIRRQVGQSRGYF